MFVKPATDLVIRDPDRLDLIPATGREVPDHHDYWIRRVRDGDVVECDPPVEEPEAPAVPESPVAPPTPPETDSAADDQPAAKGSRGK